jgi:DNA recombination protein RmuC
MGGHVDKLGRSLTRVVNDYNTTVGSLESQVMTSARKLNDIELVDAPIAEVEGLDDTVRPLTKPELVASAEDARRIVAIAAPDVPPTSESGQLALDGRVEDYGIDIAPASDAPRRTGS